MSCKVRIGRHRLSRLRAVGSHRTCPTQTIPTSWPTSWTPSRIKYDGRLGRDSIASVVERVWTELSTNARFDTYMPVLLRKASEDNWLRQTLT